MAFIRRQQKNGVNYYSLVENYRDNLKYYPQQRQIQWLGTYYEALAVVEQSQEISEPTKKRYLLKLASFEGVMSRQEEVQYQCIVCDLPWGSMEIEEVLALPVRELSNYDGCVLWLWFPNNRLIEASWCIEDWGYTQQTILTWQKPETKGDWLNNCTEHCIVATKGNVASFKQMRTLKGHSTLFQTPKRVKRKPEEFYKLVESLCPQQNKLEMFAPSQRKGWDIWTKR